MELRDISFILSWIQFENNGHKNTGSENDNKEISFMFLEYLEITAKINEGTEEKEQDFMVFHI